MPKSTTNHEEPKPTPFEWLATATTRAVRSAKFCVVGSLPGADPGLEAAGLGAIALPLKRTIAKKLVACCQVAPHGKGTRTLVDKKVRNTFQLDPQNFCLDAAWDVAIADAMRPVAEQLGLPAEQLEARLYKLLVYEKGGFFLPHRDSEKHDRMVASMVVVLPNRFEGGKLVVRHGAAEQTLAFDEAAAGAAPCYAAFYADCEHEVLPVTGGVRLCLAYNLSLKRKPGKPLAASPAAPADALAVPIGSWVAKQPAKPLVFALEHHYTQRGLSLDLLKGADRQLADLVVTAAEKADCVVQLAQVSRHLSQFADDGSFGRGFSRHYHEPRGKIQIGETYEDDLRGAQWTDLRGMKQPWGDIAFDPSAIVSAAPIDDWKPTSEDFEGYTGNAGNTLDRWYHRSAIVLWHRDHHFDVVASSGANHNVPLFCSMAEKLTKTPKKSLAAARGDCIRFARAIIARWPRSSSGYGDSVIREESPLADFPEHLLLLHDRDTIAMLLTQLTDHDPLLSVSSMVVAACREFGWSAFARELKQLISSRPRIYTWRDVLSRDIEWLSTFCGDKTKDADKSALAQELCALAVERFRESSRTHGSPRHRREVSDAEKSLPLLLKALAASGRDEDLSGVIRFVQESPDEFSLDTCQVPSLKSLIPWSRRNFGRVLPQLASWLVAVRQKLELATAREPAPPTDWARPADVDCKCQYCAQLNAFLADPANEVGRIPAREDRRQHLIAVMGKHQCDVNHALERKGSPHSLLLTKTSGSFKRSVRRFEANRRLLLALPADE